MLKTKLVKNTKNGSMMEWRYSYADARDRIEYPLVYGMRSIEYSVHDINGTIKSSIRIWYYPTGGARVTFTSYSGKTKEGKYYEETTTSPVAIAELWQWAMEEFNKF